MDKSTLLLLAVVMAVFGTSVVARYPDWGAFTGVAIILLAAGLAAGALPMRSDEYFDDRAAANQRISKSLLTLSSAAVVAIYAAGYHRTSTAAERFDQEAEQRKKGAEVAVLAPVVAQGATAAAPAAAAPAAAAATKKNGTVKAPARKSPPAGGSIKSGESSESSATASSPEDSGAKAKGRDAETEAAAAAQPKFKDGMFLGWGSCRHGDIEASVTIEGGKIVASAITQCLTRYSCTWISPRVPSDVLPDLPSEVVKRQSAKVDYVSGATESSYAFADAITAALSKASE